jgi:ABC-type transporter Mla maintaining outer membrane lipid asymmetry ATPase subunit MlaF
MDETGCSLMAELEDDSSMPDDIEPATSVPDVEAATSAYRERPKTIYIQFANVSKVYERPVLQECSFDVGRGQTLAIIGGKSSGKSLILRMLLGETFPSSGEIYFAGNLLTPENMPELRRHIALATTSSGMSLEALTVFDNVCRALERRRDFYEDQMAALCRGLLEICGLREIDAKKLAPADLSFAQRKRLTFAMALSSQPEVILCDDPTELLDPVTCEEMTQLIRRIKLQIGITFVIATKDIEVALRCADLILFLQRGETVFYGPTDEFLNATDERVQRFVSEGEL